MTKTSYAYSNGKPVVKVTLHGAIPLTLKMVVDTGADIVALPTKVCRQMEWDKLESRKVVVPGALIEVPIYSGKIEFEGLIKKVKVMAVKLPGFKVAHGLLGREFLDLFEVCFKGGKRVSFEPLE